MPKPHLILVIILVPVAAIGETVEIDSVGHYVPLNEVEWADLDNGREVYRGYRRHITSVGKEGKIHSHWCDGTNVRKSSGDAPGFEYAAGYCTIFDEDGDIYWTWFEVDGLGSFIWTVMGGVGKYKGATGGGVTTATSKMPDGTAEFEIKGKIELLDRIEAIE